MTEKHQSSQQESLQQSKPIADVFLFWNTEACGTHFVEEQKGTPEFYERYRQFRYQTEWHIPELVPFAEAKGKSVLEIGCGNGADGVMFAQNGASYTGVDLTDAAVQASLKHFEILGLDGCFRQENAEQLSFADASFDWVYSLGVLHHTPHPRIALREVHRVLKPGGRAIIMLYHKDSFNYWVRILGYMRARVIAKIISRVGHWKKDRAELLQSCTLRGIRGNELPAVYQVHYDNFLRQGWSYLRSESFVHHCTDGPECPYAFAYTKGEAQELLSGFSEIRFALAHFPLRKYRFGRWVPRSVEKTLGSLMGWNLFIYASK